MTAIAREAQTAVQTIYDSVGPKHAIILALVETIEEEAEVGSFQAQLAATTDAPTAIRLFVALTRNFAERSGDLFQMMMTASATEPDVAQAWRFANQNHRRGAGFVAAIVERSGTLRPGLAIERATDTIGALTWGSTWQQFIGQYGWSYDECQGWMQESLERLLLRDSPPD
jgi:AcrR family transcriptional regulator